MEKEEILVQHNQLTGNIGLFYAAHKLARRGWNVLITSRNAKGPDMIIYSQNGKLSHTIQVKASGDHGQVTIHESQSFLMSEFVIVVYDVYDDTKEHPMYITETTNLHLLGIGQKGGCWINPTKWIDTATGESHTEGTFGKYKDNFEALGDPWDGAKPASM